MSKEHLEVQINLTKLSQLVDPVVQKDVAGRHIQTNFPRPNISTYQEKGTTFPDKLIQINDSVLHLLEVGILKLYGFKQEGPDQE